MSTTRKRNSNSKRGGGKAKRSSLFVSDQIDATSKIEPVGAHDKSKDGEVDLSALSLNQRMRLRVGYFMQLMAVEIFFISLVVVYGGMTFIQMGLSEEDEAQLREEFQVLDLTLGSMLLVEIALKLYAFGFVYMKNCWNLFDALVVILSFVISIVLPLVEEGNTVALARFLRLRVILRLFRVLVVFERVKNQTKVVRWRKGKIEAPLDTVLRILSELRSHPGLHPRVHDDIDYVMQIIKTNRLYDTGGDILQDGDMDKDMQQWLKGEVLKNNNAANSVQQTGKNALAFHNESRHRTSSAAITTLHRPLEEQLLVPLSPEGEMQMDQLLKSIYSWDFNVFKVNEITNENPLTNVGSFIFQAQSLQEALQTNLDTISKFLHEIQQGYIQENPYHNAIHATDVFQTVLFFISMPEIDEFLTPLDAAVVLLSAAIHDFRHDGLNNAFKTATLHRLAIRYNDIAIMENFHVAEAFEVMKTIEGCDVFQNLARDDLKYARNLMIDTVLGTDMSRHFEEVAMFKAKIIPENEDEDFAVENDGDKRILLKVILHTADVSNPAKPQKIMARWTDRVIQEFFKQGDKERELELPVSAFMDRTAPTLMKSQLGFIDYIVNPLFEAWGNILPKVKTECQGQLLKNREFWEMKGESFLPSDLTAFADTIREEHKLTS